MKKFIVYPIFFILFAFLSGGSLSYIDSLIVTEEMSSYSKTFENRRGETLSEQEFEDMINQSEESLQSMQSSGFSSKRVVLDYLLLPLLIIVFSYVWFRVGLAISSEKVGLKVLYSVILVVFLMLFGYAYQPFVHALSFFLGVFKKYNDKGGSSGSVKVRAVTQPDQPMGSDAVDPD